MYLGLPPVPQDVKVIEGRRKRTIHIEWDQKIVAPQVTIFVIEERHHTGRQFNPKRLSSWDLCSRTDKYSQTLKNYAKPGRWYQFRVAAVNENGTQGFSEPSLPFILSISKSTWKLQISEIIYWEKLKNFQAPNHQRRLKMLQWDLYGSGMGLLVLSWDGRRQSQTYH